MAKILICAASMTEGRACSAGTCDAGLENDFAIMVTGLGADRAERALEMWLAHEEKPQLIVSSGFAGAFSPDLKRNTFISAAEVVRFRQGASPERFEPRALGLDGVTSCTLVTSEDLVVDHKSHAPLYQGLKTPVAVDMETTALAEVARAYGVPFAVLRMVTDTPEEPLPDFLFSFTSALTARSVVKCAASLVKGVVALVLDPKGVVSLVRNGPSWARELRSGWARYAPTVLSSLSSSSPDLGPTPPR